MGRYRVGHQQPVGGRWLSFAACALCAVAVAGALVWHAAVKRGSEADAALHEAVRVAEGGLRGETGGDASSFEAFLGDLDQEVARDAGCETSVVAWRAAGDVTDAGARLLAAYADGSVDASLVASGYLDLSGNAWGAVVWDEERWADVVLVTRSDGDEEVAVRVARMRAPEAP